MGLARHECLAGFLARLALLSVYDFERARAVSAYEGIRHYHEVVSLECVLWRAYQVPCCLAPPWRSPDEDPIGPDGPLLCLPLVPSETRCWLMHFHLPISVCPARLASGCLAVSSLWWFYAHPSAS